MRPSSSAAMATTLLLSAARAQYAINPNSVSESTRDFWCQQQTTQCPLICLDQGSSSGATRANDCDPTALTYACVCDSGLSPNVSEYSNTLPYSICTEWGSQCVSNCAGNTACQSACRADHPCGAQNPTRQNTSTLTRSRMASTTSAGPDAAVTGSAAAAGPSAARGNEQVTTESDGSTVTVYNGFSGQTVVDQSAGVKNVRVWALGVAQTLGSLGVVGAAALAFAVLL